MKTYMYVFGTCKKYVKEEKKSIVFAEKKSINWSSVNKIIYVILL